MPFPSALSSPNLTTLRSNHHAAFEYLLLGGNVTVFAARVNQATFASSFAAVTYDGVTTGAYTDLDDGMTVLISHTNNKRAAYFVGRVRREQSGVVASSTVLNINETSATVADNDYIFVLNDYRMFHELGRYVGGVYYKDYARTFSALKPIISGLQSVYAGIVSGSPAGFTVAFTASATAAASGATISSYAWTIPSGGTVTAGSISSSSVTVRFDASANEYWVKLIVTDSGSRTQTRRIPVFAIPANLSTTVSLGSSGATITGDIDNGYSATVDAFSGMSDILDNTLAVLLDVEYYNGSQTSLVSTVKFLGRIRVDSNVTKSNELTSITKRATVDLEGAAAQMSRITTPKITMRDATAAAVWDEITALTVWRATAYLLEHSTFHSLYSLSFDATDNTFLAYQLAAAQGNLLSGVNDIMQAIDGALEFAPTGEVQAVRNLNFLISAARAALVVVANFTSQDWIGFTLKHDHVLTVGSVEANGGTYFRGRGIAAASVIPYLSISPGVAQGNADGVSQLPGQVLAASSRRETSQTELNRRTGDQFASANGNDELTVDFRTGYNWITPSRYQYYTFTIAASDDTFGRAYTTSDRWWCKSVNIRHDNEKGTKEVSAVFVLETSGDDIGATGQTVNIPPPSTTTPSIPTIPTVPAYPNFPPLPPIYTPSDPTPDQIPPVINIGGVSLDGNSVLYYNSTSVWITRNFLGLNTATEITPDDLIGDIKHVAMVGQSAYLVESDGTNSVVHYIANAFGLAATWVNNGTLTGIYTLIAPTSTEGALYIKGAPNADAAAADLWNIGSGTGFGGGTIIDRTDNTVTVQATNVGGSRWQADLMTPGTDKCSRVSYEILSGGYTDLVDWIVCGVPQVIGNITFGFVSTQCVNTLLSFTDTSGPYTIKFTFAATDVCGDPITTAPVTRYSTDYGATFASEILVGTDPSGGIDTIKIGIPVLVGGDAQVRIATSAGGAYSDYGSAMPTSAVPTCIVVPRKKWAGTTNVSTNTPDYLVASSIESSGASVWKVSASGVTFTDITPTIGGFPGLATGANCVSVSWWSSSYIAAVLSFNGTPKLVTSTNGGGSWSDRGVIDDDASQIMFKKGDTTSKFIYLSNQNPAYSPSRGATLVTKVAPDDTAADPILGVLVVG